jgi:hypothetical protein
VSEVDRALERHLQVWTVAPEDRALYGHGFRSGWAARTANIDADALNPAAVVAVVELAQWLAALDRPELDEVTLVQACNKAREALGRRWT